MVRFCKFTLGALGYSFSHNRLDCFLYDSAFILVFYGKSRLKPGLSLKKGVCYVNLPLVVLAGLSVLGGFLGIPHVISVWFPGHPPHWIENYLKTVIVHTPFKGSYITEMALMISSTFLALLIFGVTCWLYLKKERGF